MKFIVFILSIIAFQGFAQTGAQALIMGNVERLCLPDSSLIVLDELPDSLDSFNTIFLFSNSTSFLSEDDVAKIDSFVVNGGGLYNGSDNWPLQAEANQMTQKLYRKESFGNYEASSARSGEAGNLNLKDLDTIPAGKTTAAFPMDYRLKVEAWISDQPLILSGHHGDGRIVVDTGYSRFYCDIRDENTDVIFERVYRFLKGEVDYR
ncbi:MAG: hypothetical protein NXI10_02240 [bacterium]|nr:hypothetical protein [bacterium]